MDARFERVVDVSTGVSLMCSFIRSWADWTEERFKGKVLERWAMVGLLLYLRFLSSFGSTMGHSCVSEIDSMDRYTYAICNAAG